MPVLPNARHELFAKALAGGNSAYAAYRSAGDKCAPHEAPGLGHAPSPREDIAARVDELSAKARGRIAAEQVAEGIRRGAPTLYRPELADLARRLALLGATDQEWPPRSASIKVRSIGGRRGIRNSESPLNTARSRRMPRLRKASSTAPAACRCLRSRLQPRSTPPCSATRACHWPLRRS